MGFLLVMTCLIHRISTQLWMTLRDYRKKIQFCQINTVGLLLESSFQMKAVVLD